MSYLHFDPSAKDASINLGFNDCRCYGTVSGAWRSVRANFGGLTSGKWYWEMLMDDVPSASCMMVGVGPADMSTTSFPGQVVDSIGYYDQSGDVYEDGVNSSYGNTYGQGDIIGVALDLDNGKIFFSINNVWQNSGDPVAGTNPASSSFTPEAGWWPWMGLNKDTAEVWANFGNNLNIGSGGGFTYTPPTGYSAIGIPNQKIYIDSSGGDLYGQSFVGQSITPDEDIEIGSIWVDTMYVGTKGNAYCYIYADSGSGPTGSALATSDPVEVKASPGGEVLFTFSTPYILSASTKYWVVFHKASDGIYFYRTTSSVYSGGNTGYTTHATDPTSGWNNDTSWDCRQFKVYSTTIPEEVWRVEAVWTPGQSQVYQNRQYRFIVKAPMLKANSSRIRIKVRAGANDAEITGASIGKRLSNDDFDGVPTRITFNGGSNDITVPATEVAFSDWITFDLDSTQEYLVHISALGFPSFFYIYRWVGGGGEDPGLSYYAISGPDDVLTPSVSYNNDGSVEAYIEAIEGDPDWGTTTTTSTTTTTTTTNPDWIDAFDDFECLSNCTDTGQCYDETGPGITIKPKGNWNKDYKPKKIKVRGNGASSWGGMKVRDDVGGGNIIGETNHTNSPQIADLDYSGTGDIERIDLPYDCTDGIWFSADEFTTTTTTSTTTTTTTTTPFDEWDDIYYYRFTQAIANRLPDWTRAQADKYSVMQQFLNVVGKELEDIVESMRRATNSMFLRTMDMRAIDLTYQIEIPYSFEFEYDFTDPTNPRPKPPDVWGIIDGNIYEISAVTDNDITSFWYEPVGDRISLGPDEETHTAGDIAKLATGDVLSATALSIGKLVATYNEPLVPGQLYITISGLTGFGYRDDRIDIPGYVELKGTTVKDSEETERIPFSYDATLLTRKFWKEISEVHIYNIQPEDATITISSVAGTMQQIPDQAYIDYDTIGGRSSSWELEEHNLQTLLQQLLPVSKVVETQPTMGFQLDVFREWMLVDASGFAIDFANVVDYTIERYRPYIYVLTSDGMLNVYNKLPEYPDLESMRLLKNRTEGPKTVIYASYEEGVLGDTIQLSARVLTKSKPVAFYYIQGAKPHHDGELQYISTAGAWGATIGESRVSMTTPTVNPPNKPYTITLEEGGCYTFILTTRYSDGTEDKDVKIIWSRYKMPIASFDLMAADATLTIPRALCFDYNHRLWLGGSFGADFKFKVLNLHADLMLIDYDKKLLYLREEYDRIWIGENDATTTSTTTTTTSTSP